MSRVRSRVRLATDLSALIKDVGATKARALTDDGSQKYQQVLDHLQSAYLLLTANDNMTQVHVPYHEDDNALD